jgi:hypothetical protein
VEGDFTDPGQRRDELDTAAPWQQTGKLELAPGWMELDEISSYRIVAMRGAHLSQFWGAGGDNLGW